MPQLDQPGPPDGIVVKWLPHVSFFDTSVHEVKSGARKTRGLARDKRRNEVAVELQQGLR